MPAAFVTGALGFIGATLAGRLRADGWEVRGVDVRADPSLGVVAGDVTEPGAWQEGARGADVVLHTAAVVSNAAGLAEQWRVNVLGTRRVLDAARDGGAGRVVHLSSVRAFSDLGFRQVFTLGGPAATTCAEFFGHYARMLGRPAPRTAPTPVLVALAAVLGPFERARGGVGELTPATIRYLARRGTYSIAKARAVLGHAPRVGLEEGMGRTEAWLRAEGLL